MPDMNADRLEALGPAETIINTLTTMTDHMVHNRPGLVSRIAGKVGARWEACTWVQEGEERVVYTVTKEMVPAKGKVKAKAKQTKTRAGVLQDDGTVVEQGTLMGEYRKPSDLKKLFPEIAAYLYQQVATVFAMDNEFAARWASYAFAQDNRDLKTILSAFLFVQPRTGEPVIEDGEVLFYDDDYRSVGEAMFLIRGKGNCEMEPKLLLRVGDVLRLPQIVEINRGLGFGNSARKVPMGRYPKAVKRWLRYREHNPKMLKGLVKGGMTNVVKALARRVHYKPESTQFFTILRWDQKLRHGHRTIAIGEKRDKVESWDDLDERAVCERIIAEGIGYKRLVGLYTGGWTPAILAACMEAGSFSDADLILITPLLEDFGLDKREPFKSRLAAAYAKATNQRAANVARNAKSKETREALQGAADVATVKALEEVTRGLRVYVMVDKSQSMQGALEKGQEWLALFLGGFPLDKLHVSVFNSQGTELKIKAPKRAAVTHAFKGHGAGGGTSYSAGLHALMNHRPADDEDVLFICVGDQAGETGLQFSRFIERVGIKPVAFGYMRVVSDERDRHGRKRWKEGTTVEMAAKHLGVPCFGIDTDMFDAQDPYAVTRILRDLIAATPVGVAGQRRKVKRVTLIETILATPLLERPVWADAT